jgi:hypothetical protein
MENDLLENTGSLFEGKRGPKPVDAQSDPERLYVKIGGIRLAQYPHGTLEKSLGISR